MHNTVQASAGDINHSNILDVTPGWPVAAAVRSEFRANAASSTMNFTGFYRLHAEQTRTQNFHLWLRSDGKAKGPQESF